MSTEKVRTPKFGDRVRGIYASKDNPQRDGFFVKKFTRTGRMNPGIHYQITDGKGSFWEYPAESTELLALLQPSEQPKAAECEVYKRERTDLEKAPEAEAKLQVLLVRDRERSAAYGEVLRQEAERRALLAKDHEAMEKLRAGGITDLSFSLHPNGDWCAWQNNDGPIVEYRAQDPADAMLAQEKQNED